MYASILGNIASDENKQSKQKSPMKKVSVLRANKQMYKKSCRYFVKFVGY